MTGNVICHVRAALVRSDRRQESPVRPNQVQHRGVVNRVLRGAGSVRVRGADDVVFPLHLLQLARRAGQPEQAWRKPAEVAAQHRRRITRRVHGYEQRLDADGPRAQRIECAADCG